MSLASLQSALASLPEVAGPEEDQGSPSDLLAVAEEFAKVLRKLGLQQTRSSTEMLGAVRESAVRLEEVHQAALDARDRAVQAERQAEKLALVLIGHIDLTVRAISLMRKAGGLTSWVEQLETGIEKSIEDAGKRGLLATGDVGERFDPEVHDSINELGITDCQVVVRSVGQRGFVLNGRVLRRAQVEIEVGQGV